MNPWSFRVSVISLVGAYVLTASGILSAVQPPLPAFIPDAPDKTKDVASYTAADVFSCIATEVRPNGHPVGNIYTHGAARLKAEWPGARDGTQIDAMLNLILGATTAANKEDARKALLDVRFILYSVMDLTDTAKADAIVRVAQQQTDPLKMRLIADLASDLFKDLYDPRLLTFVVEYVDDPEVIVIPPMSEGRHQKVTTRGGIIWGSLIQSLMDVGFERSALPPSDADKAQRKTTLRDWMTAHMAVATQKCEAFKARPGFKVNPPDRECWSARP